MVVATTATSPRTPRPDPGDYEQLPSVVGIEAARAGERLVHDDVPGNVAARHEQENGDVEAALAASPHRISFILSFASKKYYMAFIMNGLENGCRRAKRIPPYRPPAGKRSAFLGGFVRGEPVTASEEK